MNFLVFIGKKAAAASPVKLPGPLNTPAAPKTPAVPPAPAAPQAPKAPSLSELPQRMEEFAWLTGMQKNRPGHMGSPAAAPAAPAGPVVPPNTAPPKPLPGASQAAPAAPPAAPAKPPGWLQPGSTSRSAADIGAVTGLTGATSSAVGRVATGPGSIRNAINLGRSMLPGAAPAGAAAPASVAGLGAGGTAAAALYGAYALGDVPVSAYTLATGQDDLHQRSVDQGEARGNDSVGGYLQNVGGNLARPGLATADLYKGQYNVATEAPGAVAGALQGSFNSNAVEQRNKGWAQDEQQFNNVVQTLGAKSNLAPHEQALLANAQSSLANLQKNKARAASPFRTIYGY